ncbi:MAG: restriction endonuclease, partial [Candidatus Thorarchaeota archaeon]
MAKLKILASGKSRQAQAQARGKLFEKLMADVLRHYGYTVDRIPNVNYAGMEIDIEGKASMTGIRLYAECKCYETEVDCPKLQAFYGKYMAMWLRDKHCQGLFIALPGVNSHAKGFYHENCDGSLEITVRLLEEEQVLEAIFQTKGVMGPDDIARAIEKQMGTPGDRVLLYTDKGFFWIQYVIPPNGGIATGIALFDAMGKALSDRTTIDYLTKLYPELEDFHNITAGGPITIQLSSIQQDGEEIVEVKGSSACFEYQFPASPEYFVGRQPVLEELDSFVAKVINKETSSRGILFEANSGWGKSSVVLASVARLKKMGYFAIAIDSRSASSSQFILRVIDYALSQFRDVNHLLSNNERSLTITGFEGAVRTLLNAGQALERNRKVIVIFLDQFENVFALPETLKQIRDVLLKICDAETNVILGFSWKTDLVGLTSEFPYQPRDAIIGSSKCISLGTFSDVETTALLDKLGKELRAPLRKDLRFFLSEFSQGYPWLLKKLCAHVKSQREAHVPQSDIAHSLLNIEELFEEDLRGLSPEENDTLLQIAKAAPIRVSELSEELSPQIIQSLVNRRLVVSIGNKLDVYWDIFRDYLNSGSVPVQENYILRTAVGSVLKAIKLLASANGTLSASVFREE